MLLCVHRQCGCSFLVPDDCLGQVVSCPQDGGPIHLPSPPPGECEWLRRYGEDDWLRESNLGHLLRYAAARVSRRRQRLLAAACCRRVWHLLPDERSQAAVRAAEDYADGVIRLGAFSAASDAAAAAAGGRIGHAPDARGYAASAARGAVTLNLDSSATALWAVASDVRHALAGSPGSSPRAGSPEWAAQASLVREILGNPFRPAALDPALLHWHDGTVPALARAAYDARTLPAGTLDNTRLAVLADAAEDAGCVDAPLLAHLRAAGTHVRGCWALDALLCRE